MPFAATGMNYCTKGLTYYVNKSERQISHDITYMWNLKYDTNEPIYEKTKKQNQRHKRTNC